MIKEISSSFHCFFSDYLFRNYFTFLGYLNYLQFSPDYV